MPSRNISNGLFINNFILLCITFIGLFYGIKQIDFQVTYCKSCNICFNKYLHLSVILITSYEMCHF